MTLTESIVSPVNGQICATVALRSAQDVVNILNSAESAQKLWRETPLAKRIAVLSAAVDAFVAQAEPIAQELCHLIGRPLRHGHNEVRGFAERARYLLSIAEEALADTVLPKENFKRVITKEPLGLVFVIAPWNYPYLTAVNSVWPALLAGKFHCF